MYQRVTGSVCHTLHIVETRKRADQRDEGREPTGTSGAGAFKRVQGANGNQESPRGPKAGYGIFLQAPGSPAPGENGSFRS